MGGYHSGGECYFVGERMNFNECESYCSQKGGAVACVADETQQMELQAKKIEAGCEEVWVGYNDYDGDGRWKWPVGCSSSRIYGDCGLHAPCDDHADLCVADTNNVAYCSETSQCCACSFDSCLEAHRKEGDKNESNDILVPVALVIVSILLGITLVTAVACVYKNHFHPGTVVVDYRATPQPTVPDATAPPVSVQMATFPTAKVVISTDNSSTQNKFCVNCGALLNAGNRFCGNCGAQIGV